ncbi:hypothetical protein PGT21_002334 [Puccinia graminis f. sp. tritici]|uniref:Uncharacterized protein n=1 Tax=Puccinia graminis f. sp. tritici TaxID=56615 RepID=A0A5B0PH42_PUCGR|nr:hypothetical protein PGT21_002334 [Puccinia graminis f. sp. tritici]
MARPSSAYIFRHRSSPETGAERVDRAAGDTPLTGGLGADAGSKPAAFKFASRNFQWKNIIAPGPGQTRERKWND